MKHKKVANEEPRRKLFNEIKEMIGKCQGPDCKYVVGYRDGLIKEEKGA